MTLLNFIDLDEILTVNSMWENKFFEPWSKVGAALTWKLWWKQNKTILSLFTYSVCDEKVKNIEKKKINSKTENVIDLDEILTVNSMWEIFFSSHGRKKFKKNKKNTEIIEYEGS